jgi:D-methionine transport system ATP-binding protein
MIFQHFNLLDRSTVFENVAYPLQYTGKSKKEISDRVFELLELVGLSEKADVYPSQLSGGQKQRVAIARALANNPQILLSDEATSALDPEATESILELLKELNKKLNLTIILITHEMAVIKSVCNKVAVMENGKIVESGNVYEVFANPLKEITGRFVESQSSLSNIGKLVHEKSELIQLEANGRLLKLQFEGSVAGKAAISQISRLFSVDVNIVLANIDILSDGALGRIIVAINGTKDSVEKALAYLEENKIKVFPIDPEFLLEHSGAKAV